MLRKMAEQKRQIDPGTRAKRIALRLLGVRAWSRAEMLTRLARRGSDQASALAAVGELERAGLMGDARYAEERVRSELAKRPAADVLLEHILTSRGVAASLATSIAQKITHGQSESARAIELVRTSMRDASLRKNPLAERRRLGSLLARRGFDAEITESALESALGPVPEVGDEARSDHSDLRGDHHGTSEEL